MSLVHGHPVYLVHNNESGLQLQATLRVQCVLSCSRCLSPTTSRYFHVFHYFHVFYYSLNLFLLKLQLVSWSPGFQFARQRPLSCKSLLWSNIRCIFNIQFFLWNLYNHDKLFIDIKFKSNTNGVIYCLRHFCHPYSNSYYRGYFAKPISLSVVERANSRSIFSARGSTQRVNDRLTKWKLNQPYSN